MPPIWLITILARTGVAERFQRLAAWAAMLVVPLLVLGLLVAAFHRRDDKIATEAVQVHEADITAVLANRQIEAERAATANQMATDQILANHQHELRNEAHDKGDQSSVGPGVDAVMRKLRQQQAGH
jgi:hypothetical protein